MMMCRQCGHVMVKASYYDPDGLLPLLTVTDEQGIMWACMVCLPSSRIKQEDKDA